MEAVVNLLALYAGLVFLNVLLSGLLWYRNRSPLHRSLFVVWTTTLVALVGQGATSTGGPFTIVAGFSTVFFVNLALAHLFSNVTGAPVPNRPALALWAGSLAVSAGIAAAQLPFAAIALPVAMAVAFPLSVTLWTVVSKSWGKLTTSGRGLTVASMMFVLHNLDFVVLRPIDSAAAAGFTVAILIVFALSIFAPAVVLEITTEAQARSSAEMEVAHRIQARIVPREPRLQGLDIACYMKPAEEVGGDYYDVFSDGRHSWILIGDVTGHGLSSGLVMLMAQSTVSAILHARPNVTPSELNYLANKVLFQNLRRLEEFRTMTIVALCRTEEGNEFVFSGLHDNIYVWRAASGTVETIPLGHLPHGLGFLDDFPADTYEQARLTLAKDDLLFLGTDGITEASRLGSYEAGMFEEERLVELIRAHAGEPVEQIRDAVVRELEAFTGGVYHDDVTFLVARATV